MEGSMPEAMVACCRPTARPWPRLKAAAGGGVVG